MKTFKILRHITEAEASPMIKPPKNEFGTKADAFAHAKKTGAGKVFKKSFTHPLSGQKHVSYVVKEDAEQIDELKRTTLANYISKAAGSYGRDKQNIGRESPDGTVAKARPELKRAVKNRLTGINRAAERLAKEEIEIDEASKKPNATTRHLRQYPVSDKDVAKPVKQSEYQHHVVSKLDGNVLASYKSKEAAHRNAYGNPVVSGSLETIGDRKYVREQGVAEGLNEMDKSQTPPGRDGGHQFGPGPKVSKKVTKAVNKDPAKHLSDLFAKEYDKKKQGVAEAVPFSYGFVKPPRKGSVAYNALMKRKEQDKNRVKEIEAIGTKNHHVGVAKVTKEEIEDVTEAKDTEMYKYIDQSGGHQIKGKSGTYVGYTHSATKGKGANILKHNQTKKYYAAGGSSTAFTQKTTLHDTPQAAARAYHKGNLAEQDEKEAQEYDYEGDMARSDLRSIIFNAQEVHDMLEPNTNLPEWVQAKITKAEDYMSSVRDYMKAENENL